MKNCMFCAHMDISQGGCGSEQTGCWSGSADCRRGHDLGYVSDRTAVEIENLGRFVLIASACPDYQLHIEIVKSMSQIALK